MRLREPPHGEALDVRTSLPSALDALRAAGPPALEAVLRSSQDEAASDWPVLVAAVSVLGRWFASLPEPVGEDDLPFPEFVRMLQEALAERP